MTIPRVTTPRGRRKVSRRGKALTSTERAEAIALWRAGTVTLDELAAKFDRDRTTFLRLFNKEGAVKGELAREHEKRVEEAVEDAAITDVAITAQRIRETKEDHYKYAKYIAGQVTQVLAKTRQEGRAIGTALNDLKALNIASQTFKTVREERYALLGLNDEQNAGDEKMPDLVIQELTAGEIKNMHRAMEETDEMTDVGEGMVLEDDDGSLPS